MYQNILRLYHPINSDFLVNKVKEHSSCFKYIFIFICFLFVLIILFNALFIKFGSKVIEIL